MRKFFSVLSFALCGTVQAFVPASGFSLTHQGTQINAGNLVVMADNDATFVASQVNVQNDAIVQAGNDLNIEGRADSTVTEKYSKTDTTTVTAGVKNAYVDTALAADAVTKAGEDVKRAERALRDAKKRVKDGTDKYDGSDNASSFLQVPHDAKIRVEFDTKQILDDIEIPKGKWGTAEYHEPITKDFPEFGSGGASQAVTNSPLNVNKIKDLKNNEVLYERK